MKTTKFFNALVATTAILLGFQAQAQQQAQNKIGEKYKCQIETTDEKKYLLDIGWSKIYDNSGNDLVIEKEIFFELKDLETQNTVKKSFDSVNFSSFYSTVDIDEQINSIALTASEYKCLRPGCYNKYFSAQFDVYRITTLKSFDYSYTTDGYFQKNEEIHLNIAKSTCDWSFEKFE